MVIVGVVVGMVVFGVIMILIVFWVLLKIVLKGVLIYYIFELFLYCKLKVWNIIVCVIFDKLIYVLKWVIVVVVFVVVLIWLFVNIFIGDISLFMYFVNFLDLFVKMLGFDGFILVVFIFGLFVNEIVILILLMFYLLIGVLIEIDDFN